MGVRKVAVIIAYNGVFFRGFQRQPSGDAVENYLEKVLLENKVIDEKFSSKNTEYSASGRTDKGVHAIYQVISFNSKKDPEEIINIINSCLEPKIIAWGFLENIPWDFNARMWARSRYYMYYLGRLFVNRKAVGECIDNARRNDIKYHVLSIGGDIAVFFRANSFLKGEIRRIIGCAIRKNGLAEPQNLCLIYVSYPFTAKYMVGELSRFLKENSFVPVLDFLRMNIDLIYSPYLLFSFL